MTPVPTPTGPLSRFLQDPEAFLLRLAEALREIVPMAILALAAVAVLVLGVGLLRWWREARLSKGARHLRILPPPTVEPAGSQMLWMGLHALLRPWWSRIILGQPHLAWEVTARPELVEVSLWVPRVVPPGLIERAVQASWPGASTVVTTSDPISSMGQTGTACVEDTELVLAERDWFPIGTPGGDSLALVLAGLTGLADGEAVAIQLVARPATSASRRRLRRAARSIRAGARLAWRADRAPANRLVVVDPAAEGDVRAVLGKASSPLWTCSLRVAVTSPRRDWARGRIHGVAGAFAVFEGRNGFRRSRMPGGLRRMGARRLARSYLLSVPEVAEIATLPPAGAVPGLERAAAGTVPPSRVLPRKGKVLGKAESPGPDREVAISVEDARHHMHVIGETGTGKSTLLARLVLQDAEAGRSAVVIDPKGDLVEAILERLPEGAIERTCLIDPDREWAVGLNVLGGDDRDLTVEHVLGVFRRIYEPWWGPRTDDVMRAACLTLTQIPGTTLVEVPLLLTDFGWRREVRERLADIAGLSAFWQWYDRLPEGQRAQHIAPLLNKLRAFVLRGPVRAIVGQPEPKLDIPRLIDSGGLLLVRIPKGTLGDETSRLLGAFVVARVWQACMRRASRAESARPDTSLYVDEMHNYLALPKSFEDLLAEARGYRLSLVLAHQHLGQLPREMRDALASNARTKIAFTCSPEDAFILEHHFSPQLTAHDLSHLTAFQAACRPCVASGHGTAFTFVTEALGSPQKGRADATREASDETFGERRSLVEVLVNRRHERITEGRYPIPEERREVAPQPAGG